MVCVDCMKKDQLIKEMSEAHSRQRLKFKAKVIKLKRQMKILNHSDIEGHDVTDNENYETVENEKELAQLRENLRKKEEEMKAHVLRIMSLEEQLQSQEDKSVLRSLDKTSHMQSLNAEALYAQLIYKDAKLLEVSTELSTKDQKISLLEEDLREQRQLIHSKHQAEQILRKSINAQEQKVADLEERLEHLIVPLDSPFFGFPGQTLPVRLREQPDGEPSKPNSCVANHSISDRNDLFDEHTSAFLSKFEPEDKQSLETLNSRLTGMMNQIDNLQNGLFSSSNAETLDIGIKKYKGKKKVTFDLSNVEADAQIAALEAQVEDGEKKRDSLLAELNESRTQNNSLERRLTVSIDLDEHESKIKALKQEHQHELEEQKLKALHNQAKSQVRIRELELAVENINEVHESSILFRQAQKNISSQPDVTTVSIQCNLGKHDIEKLELKITKLAIQFDEKCEELKTTLQNLNESQSVCTKLQSELNREKTDRSVEVSNFQLVVSEANALNIVLKNDIDCRLREIQELDGTLQKSELVITTLENDVSLLTQNNDELRETNSQQQQDIMYMKEEHKAIMKRLKESINELQKRCRNYQDEIHHLNESLHDWQHRSELLVDDEAKLQVQLEKYKNYNRQLEADSKQFVVALSKAENELERERKSKLAIIDENDENKQKLSDLEISANKWKSDVNDQKLLIKNLDIKLIAMDKEMKVIREKKDEFETIIEKLTFDKEVLEDDFNSKMKYCNKMEQKLSESERCIENIKLQLQNILREKSELEDSLSDADSELMSMQSVIEKSDEIIDLLENELNDRKGESETLRTRIFEYGEMMANFRSTSSGRRSRDLDSKNSVKVLVGSFERRTFPLKNNIALMQDACKNMIPQSEMDEMRQMLKSSETVIYELESQLTLANQEADDMRKKMINYEKILLSLQSQQSGFKDELERGLTDSKLKFKAFEAKSRLLSVENEQLQAKLQSLSMYHEEVVDANKQLENEVNNLRDDLNKLKVERDDLTLKLQDMRNQCNLKDNKNYAAVNDSFALEVQQIRKEAATLSSELISALNQKENLKLRLDSLQTQFDSLFDEKNILLDEKQELEAEMHVLWDEKSTLKRQIAETLNNLTTTLDQKSAIESKLSLLLEHNNATDSKLSDIMQENIQIKEENQVLKEKIDLSTNLHVCTNDKNALEDVINSLHASLNEKNQSIVNLTADKSELLTTNEKFKKLLSKAKLKITSLESENLTSMQELETIKTTLHATTVEKDVIQKQLSSYCLTANRSSEKEFCFQKVEESAFAEITILNNNEQFKTEVCCNANTIDYEYETNNLRHLLEQERMEFMIVNSNLKNKLQKIKNFALESSLKECELISKNYEIERFCQHYKTSASDYQHRCNELNSELTALRLSLNAVQLVHVAIQTDLEDGRYFQEYQFSENEVDLNNLCVAENHSNGYKDSLWETNVDELNELKQKNLGLLEERQHLCEEVIKLNNTLDDLHAKNNEYEISFIELNDHVAWLEAENKRLGQKIKVPDPNVFNSSVEVAMEAIEEDHNVPETLSHSSKTDDQQVFKIDFEHFQNLIRQKEDLEQLYLQLQSNYNLLYNKFDCLSVENELTSNKYSRVEIVAQEFQCMLDLVDVDDVKPDQVGSKCSSNDDNDFFTMFWRRLSAKFTSMQKTLEIKLNDLEKMRMVSTARSLHVENLQVQLQKQTEAFQFISVQLEQQESLTAASEEYSLRWQHLLGVCSKELKHLQHINKALRQELLNANETNELFSDEVASLKQFVVNSENQRAEELRKESSTNAKPTVELLKHELDDALTSKESALNTLRERENQIFELQTALEKGRLTSNELGFKLNDLESKNLELAKVNLDLTAKLQVETENTVSVEVKNELERELCEVKNYYNIAEASVLQLQEENNFLRNVLDELNDKFDSISKELDENCIKLEQAHRELDLERKSKQNRDPVLDCESLQEIFNLIISILSKFEISDFEFELSVENILILLQKLKHVCFHSLEHVENLENEVRKLKMYSTISNDEFLQESHIMVKSAQSSDCVSTQSSLTNPVDETLKNQLAEAETTCRQIQKRNDLLILELDDSMAREKILTQEIVTMKSELEVCKSNEIKLQLLMDSEQKLVDLNENIRRKLEVQENLNSELKMKELQNANLLELQQETAAEHANAVLRLQEENILTQGQLSNKMQELSQYQLTCTQLQNEKQEILKLLEEQKFKLDQCEDIISKNGDMSCLIEKQSHELACAKDELEQLLQSQELLRNLLSAVEVERDELLNCKQDLMSNLAEMKGLLKKETERLSEENSSLKHNFNEIIRIKDDLLKQLNENEIEKLDLLNQIDHFKADFYAQSCEQAADQNMKLNLEQYQSLLYEVQMAKIEIHRLQLFLIDLEPYIKVKSLDNLQMDQYAIKNVTNLQLCHCDPINLNKAEIESIISNDNSFEYGNQCQNEVNCKCEWYKEEMRKLENKQQEMTSETIRLALKNEEWLHYVNELENKLQTSTKQIDYYEKENRLNLSSIEDYKRQLSEAELKCFDAQSIFEENRGLIAQIEELLIVRQNHILDEKRLNEIEDELFRLNAEKQKCNDERLKFQTDSFQLNTENQNLMQSLNDERQSREYIDQCYQKFERIFAKLAQFCNSFGYSANYGGYADLDNLFTAVERMVCDSRNECAELRRQLALNADRVEENFQMQQNLRTVGEEIGSYKLKLDELIRERDAIKLEHSQIRKENEIISAKLDASLFENANLLHNLDLCKKDLFSYQEKCGNLEEKLIRTNGEIVVLSEQIIEKGSEHSKLKSLIESLKLECSQLNSSIIDIQSACDAKIASLLQNLETENLAATERYENELQNVKSNLQFALLRENDLTEALNVSKLQCEELKSEQSSLQATYDGTIEKSNDTIEKLQVELRENQLNCDEMARKYGSAEERIEQLLRRLNLFEQRVVERDLFYDELNIVRRDYNALLLQNNQLTSRISELEVTDPAEDDAHSLSVVLQAERLRSAALQQHLDDARQKLKRFELINERASTSSISVDLPSSEDSKPAPLSNAQSHWSLGQSLSSAIASSPPSVRKRRANLMLYSS